MSDEWKCRTCDSPMSERWVHWPKDHLWEFLTKCPKCGDQVMVYHQDVVPQFGCSVFMPSDTVH